MAPAGNKSLRLPQASHVNYKYIPKGMLQSTYLPQETSFIDTFARNRIRLLENRIEEEVRMCHSMMTTIEEMRKTIQVGYECSIASSDPITIILKHPKVFFGSGFENRLMEMHVLKPLLHLIHDG